jgi:hypothetical protein
MKEYEFIKLNFKFEVSNFCANVKVKITSLRTAVHSGSAATCKHFDSAGV